MKIFMLFHFAPLPSLEVDFTFHILSSDSTVVTSAAAVIFPKRQSKVMSQ